MRARVLIYTCTLHMRACTCMHGTYESEVVVRQDGWAVIDIGQEDCDHGQREEVARGRRSTRGSNDENVDRGFTCSASMETGHVQRMHKLASCRERLRLPSFRVVAVKGKYVGVAALHTCMQCSRRRTETMRVPLRRLQM